MSLDSIKIKFKSRYYNGYFFSERAGYNFTNNKWRKSEQKKGRYVPRYGIMPDYKNPDKKWFYMELSIPKLLFGDNITDIHEYDFETLVQAIFDFCQEIGMPILKPEIRATEPTLFAISKNIDLSDICSCKEAIRVLKFFDYKTYSKHRKIEFNNERYGGSEIIFSTKQETFKIYDKLCEVQNNAKSEKELQNAELIKNNQLKKDGNIISELLRLELTLKTHRKIQHKLGPYLKNKRLSLKNLFQEKIWERALKDEVNISLNHPLQKIILLSLENENLIDEFLNKHYSHIQTKDTIKTLIMKLKRFGLAQTRAIFMNTYLSRQTWHNYMKRLVNLQKHINYKEISQITNAQIHSYILQHFDIHTSIQDELGLNIKNKLSKNIDSKHSNTYERKI